MKRKFLTLIAAVAAAMALALSAGAEAATPETAGSLTPLMPMWDPTDPDSANPWDAAFRSGTAIRSEAAWNEWNDAQNDGRWNGSINPTDLQGWSTDSSVEGTRG